ncbi:MAG: methylthioribose-1-phosphate isomerase [Bacteroidia bacterium]|nr:MAG: methylthioribose-1-phosphate isomerase [Bacteroidia bacterium]
MASDLEVIGWREGKLWFLDQRLLPAEERIVETEEPEEVCRALKSLAIRGAPLIGIAAAYGMALGLRSGMWEEEGLGSRLERLATLFLSTRPTAVNLFKAVDRVRRSVFAHRGSGENAAEAALREARMIHEEEQAMCRGIADHGANLLSPGSVVLTHCNSGALATGGIGTALGVIRRAWERGTLRHVYMNETRPLLQGARLTAWELGKLGIPATLIVDSASAFLMQGGRVHAVIVGADRIAANGDTANKIGTYALALAAHHHGIPFYVAAPTSTIDLAARAGKDIPIEVRSEEELVMLGSKRVAPEGTAAYNPAFDVTPGSLITAIVTERGVVRPPYTASLAATEERVQA